MKTFDIISYRDASFRTSVITRPDLSKPQLEQWKRDGYTQVVFVAHPGADTPCQDMNGNIYIIDDIIGLDNPLYRVGHPNDLCSFAPYGEKINNERNTIK